MGVGVVLPEAEAENSRFASLSSPFPSAAVATDGTYARTSTSTRMLAKDPNVAGRVWGTDGSYIGYRDNFGTGTFVQKIAHPSAQSPVQITFTASWMFVLTSGFANKSGQLWRSPAPAADASGLSFSGVNGKMQDLTGFALGIAGAATDGGDTSYYRYGCFATDGTNGYLIEYGATITGGPSFYQCANVNVIDVAFALFSKRKTWSGGKHGHAVEVIGGVPWAAIGDGGAAGTYADIGLWTATAANGATWNRRSLYGEISNGNYNYPIDFLAMTIGGASVVVGEYDGYGPSGPLVFDSQDPTVTRPLRQLCALPYPYTGSMRSLTLTNAGHLMWVTTGEGGAIGTYDTVWIAKAPFVNPIMLESIASTSAVFGTLGKGFTSGSGASEYAFFGSQQVRVPQLL